MEAYKMKKTLLVLLTVLLMLCCASVAVFAEGEDLTPEESASSVEVSDETSSESSEESSEESSQGDDALNLQFYPDGFTRNIQYMGLGMLGIFVVVGVVIVLTLVLNKVTTNKE